MGNQQNKLLPQEPQISHLVFRTALTLFDCSFYYYLFFQQQSLPLAQDQVQQVCITFVVVSQDCMQTFIFSSPRQYGKSQKSGAKTCIFHRHSLSPRNQKYFSFIQFIPIFHITMFLPPCNNIAPTTDGKALVKLRVNIINL